MQRLCRMNNSEVCRRHRTRGRRAIGRELCGFVMSLCVTVPVIADSPVSLLATNTSIGNCMQLLAGPTANVRLCKLSADKTAKLYVQSAALDTFVIFVERGSIDPMVAERLSNQGHRIYFLDVPRRHCGDLSRCVRLRALCEYLVACFPERAKELRARLDAFEFELRTRARLRANRKCPSLV